MSLNAGFALAGAEVRQAASGSQKGQDIRDLFSSAYARERREPMSLNDYLEGCRDNPGMTASAAERMITAIGEPVVVDTSKDSRLGRIFLNRTIKLYPSMAGFFGMEDTIQRVVSYFQHAAQGLEERKQILYLLGPVGGGKSSLAERLKALMETQPIYVLAVGDELSPVFESPLGLFRPEAMGEALESRYGIPLRRLTGICSPWAAKRLDAFDGDISRFSVVKLYPSKLRQIGVAKTEPGDENNQDISTLVGKVDIRKLEHFSQHDPDAYSYSGGLNRTTQGLLEFVEMFKAPIKVLHPLLTATQEGNYAGTENLGALPFQGIVLAHSNESEWEKFQEQQEQRGLSRPHLRRQGPLLPAGDRGGDDLREAPRHQRARQCLLRSRGARVSRPLLHPDPAQGARELAALFEAAGLQRRKSQGHRPQGEVGAGISRCAGVAEGMSGVSTRFAFKVLSETFNFDNEEIAADPVHLMYVLEQAIKREQFPKDVEHRYLDFIKSVLAPRYAEFIGREIQKAYIESYSEYGQNLFDRYIAHADAWIEEQDYKDPDTGQVFDRQVLDAELSKTEKPAGIANPKDFRNEIVKFALRSRAANQGKNPSWTSYEKIREVIEKRMFSQVEDLLPIISFGAKQDSKTEKQHADFLDRMKARGYTERQVRRLVEWYMRVNKAG